MYKILSSAMIIIFIDFKIICFLWMMFQFLKNGGEFGYQIVSSWYLKKNIDYLI